MGGISASRDFAGFGLFLGTARQESTRKPRQYKSDELPRLAASLPLRTWLLALFLREMHRIPPTDSAAGSVGLISAI